MASLKYYIWASYRRKRIDKLQEKYIDLYKGTVLDIGGRDRGKFEKPKNKVDKWIFADIEAKHNPDIILDVANMSNVETQSIDVVNAVELFEHVEKINEGIAECYRILKPDGKLIISVPFLYPVHADPFDFRRWTRTKWENELKKAGFKITDIEIIGRYFTVINDMKKTLIKSLPPVIRLFAYLLFPIFDIFNKLDETNFIKNHPKLGKYHGGYFIIASKN